MESLKIIHKGGHLRCMLSCLLLFPSSHHSSFFPLSFFISLSFPLLTIRETHSFCLLLFSSFITAEVPLSRDQVSYWQSYTPHSLTPRTTPPQVLEFGVSHAYSLEDKRFWNRFTTLPPSSTPHRTTPTPAPSITTSDAATLSPITPYPPDYCLTKSNNNSANNTSYSSNTSFVDN